MGGTQRARTHADVDKPVPPLPSYGQLAGRRRHCFRCHPEKTNATEQTKLREYT